VDRITDHRLAEFVLCEHMRGHPDMTQADAAKIKPRFQSVSVAQKAEPIDQDLFKKYILYARQHVFPLLNAVEKEKIASFYSGIRQLCEGRGGLKMTVRHIEAMLRMSQAFARLKLKNVVEKEDIDHSISIMLNCFCQSQKLSLAEELRQKFRGFIDVIHTESDLCFMQLKRLFREADTTQNLRRQLLSQDQLPDEDLGEIEISTESFIRAVRKLGFTKDPLQLFKDDKIKYHYKLARNKSVIKQIVHF